MLSNERDDIKLGVVRFTMGVAMALYYPTCRALEQYRNEIRFPINLSAVMAISGWLPCSKFNSCKESCLDLLLHVKPCGNRVGHFVIKGLLKDLMESNSLKLP
nr:alpha/beta hydrolase fold protein [Tanacetum cinerariifolium]